VGTLESSRKYIFAGKEEGIYISSEITSNNSTRPRLVSVGVLSHTESSTGRRGR